MISTSKIAAILSGKMNQLIVLYIDWRKAGLSTHTNFRISINQNRKSKFLIYGEKMLDKCVKSQKKIFVHCPFLQSQAK